MSDSLAPFQMKPCGHGCFEYEDLHVSKAHAEQLHMDLEKERKEFAAYRLTHP